MRDRRRLGPAFWVAVVWVAVVVVVCALAPLLPLANPNQTLHGPPSGGFTYHNWLGTDDGGRDLLSRTIWGGTQPISGRVSGFAPLSTTNTRRPARAR